MKYTLENYVTVDIMKNVYTNVAVRKVESNQTNIDVTRASMHSMEYKVSVCESFGSKM